MVEWDGSANNGATQEGETLFQGHHILNYLNNQQPERLDVT